jgi:hypothetical protein
MLQTMNFIAKKAHLSPILVSFLPASVSASPCEQQQGMPIRQGKPLVKRALHVLASRNGTGMTKGVTIRPIRGGGGGAMLD